MHIKKSIQYEYCRVLTSCVHVSHTMVLLYTTEIVKLTVASSCADLTSIDISKNELTSLPASITKLPNLERLNASRNYLTQLPARYNCTLYITFLLKI